MTISDISGLESGNFTPIPQAVNTRPKLKTLGFALIIIFGIGGLVAAGVGLGGVLQLGSLSGVGQVNSIIILVIGGGGGIPLLIIGIIGFVKSRSGGKIEDSRSGGQAKKLETDEIEEKKQVIKAEPTQLGVLETKKEKKEAQESKATKQRIEPKQEIRKKEIKVDSLEIFIKKVRFFNTRNKTAQEIASDLSKITPKKLQPQEIVNILFEHSTYTNMKSLLDAVLVVHPLFTLSAYDQIRKAIVEDTQHSLTHSSLFDMFKEHGLDRDEEKITACYDLAYRTNHPYIYRLSPTSVAVSEYTLNFLWINLNPQDRNKNLAENIFKEGLDLSENAECIKDPDELRQLETHEQSLTEEELEKWQKIKKSFTYKISKWADVNPQAQINVWYDSALVTQQAQQKTFEMMRAISKSRGVDLRLRDIRQLSNIRGEIEHSLHPGTPVYYRVDMLKALIADHMISSSEEKAKYCVVSDIDVEPMPPQQLFDARTLDYLDTNGYVFNRVGLGNFENSFFIFNREKDNLKRVHYNTIIKRIASLITSYRKDPPGTDVPSTRVLHSQSVFEQYPKFVKGMKEPEDQLLKPRKVVKCPRSQFNCGDKFAVSDYRKERFRFIGRTNTPYTKYGRNFRARGERQIPALRNWKAQPLNLTQ